MNKLLNLFAGILLLLNGVGALYGGIALMLEPDGKSMELSLKLLNHSPFHDFFIPGLILVFTNGVTSAAVLTLMMLQYKHFPGLIFIQGVILTGWIAVQVALIHTTSFLHIFYGATGIALALIGYTLYRSNK